MPDDIFDKNGDGADEISSEDSTAEMDVIKQAFQEEAQEAGADVFSVDLFGQADADAPTQPEPDPEPPANVESPLEGGDEAGIKIVTDDDLKDLFDASSPGDSLPDDESAAEEIEPAQDAPSEDAQEQTAGGPPLPPKPRVSFGEYPEHDKEIELKENLEPTIDETDGDLPGEDIEEIGLEDRIGQGALGEDEPSEEQQEEPAILQEPGISSPQDEQIEEIGLDDTGPAEESWPSSEEPPAQESAEQDEPIADDSLPQEQQAEAGDDSPDEIVEQLETRAQVGEMTSATAGKKGELLEKTSELIQGLDPAGDDFMSVEELRKLFNNVNVLTRLMQGMSERIDRLEDEIEKMKNGEN